LLHNQKLSNKSQAKVRFVWGFLFFFLVVVVVIEYTTTRFELGEGQIFKKRNKKKERGKRLIVRLDDDRSRSWLETKTKNNKQKQQTKKTTTKLNKLNFSGIQNVRPLPQGLQSQSVHGPRMR